MEQHMSIQWTNASQLKKNVKRCSPFLCRVRISIYKSVLKRGAVQVHVLPFIEQTTIRARPANRNLMYLQFLHKGYACYRPKIKLQECNIFTGMCLFTGERWVSIQMRNYKIRSTSGRYTSYWNAFLFLCLFGKIKHG